MRAIPKYICWPIIDSSSLYRTIYMLLRCCYTPNRCARGHIRSRVRQR